MSAPSETFAGLLASLASAAPDRPALTCGEQVVTRADLERRSNRLALAYEALGVTPGSMVTIGLPNSVDFMVAALAVWKCGATPQPVSAKLPPRELAAIVELASPSLVVGIDPANVPGFTVAPSSLEPGSADADVHVDRGAAPSWKAPTSGGSTGRPKLIVATQPATATVIASLARLVTMHDDDTVLITGPLSHNAPFLLATAGLALGGHVVIMPRFDPVEALRLVHREHVTWMYVVPTMMSRILRLPAAQRDGFDISSLRVVMHMAAPCPPWVKRDWIEWIGPERLYELYAGTEMQAATLLTGTEWLDRPGTVGRAAVGEIIVLGADGETVPPGVVGEVWMRRGEGMDSPYRYIGAEPVARDGGWESLGDMGHMDTEGYLYLTDRKADLILVGGANVYPAEIESALLEHPDVRSAVVVGVAHEDLGQVPHAFVEAVAPVSDHDMDRHLRERLAAYKLPRSYDYVDHPLRDDAGKVRRSALTPGNLGVRPA